jgi:transposase
MDELARLIESGPDACGFMSGVWTSRMVGQLIEERYDVLYHWKYVPELLHKLGFSVQRPRKLLSRADHEAQERWIRKTLPAIKKKAEKCRGVLLFEDEASFQLDPTLHWTWHRVGVQPRVPTRGERKTAHVYGALALDDAKLTYSFTRVFNGDTFLQFLKRLVKRYERKIFLIIDNAPFHRVGTGGRAWLEANADRIELHRLPAYSPELNAIEGVWKKTRRQATHNRYFRSPEERDAALRTTFRAFQRQPQHLVPCVARFRA